MHVNLNPCPANIVIFEERPEFLPQRGKHLIPAKELHRPVLSGENGIVPSGSVSLVVFPEDVPQTE
jgi:hypothetical protein